MYFDTMNEECFFSVIVPAFNVENYIESTVQSILHQSFSDFFLLLVDDGSTDSTAEICRRLAAEYPQKISYLRQKNCGVSSARNAGIEASRGQYIVFVDGDDILHEDALAVMKECVNETATDLLYCDLQKVMKAPVEFPVITVRVAKNVTAKECILKRLGEDTIPAVAACYRREMIEKEHIRFDEKQSFVEDALFFFECVVKAESINYLPEALYYYVQHGDSKSHRKDSVLREIKNELRGWKRIKKLLPNDKETDAVLIPRVRRIRKGYFAELLSAIRKATVIGTANERKV